MPDDTLRTHVEGAVATLTLHRPDVLNALNIPLMDSLIEAMESFDQDPNVRAMVLTGGARADRKSVV